MTDRDLLGVAGKDGWASGVSADLRKARRNAQKPETLCPSEPAGNVEFSAAGT